MTSQQSSSSGNPPHSNGPFTIKIKTLDSRQVQIQVHSDLTVSSLKNKISQVCQVPVQRQRLIFQGRVLRNDCTLGEYSLEHNHVIHLVLMPEQPNSSTSSSGGTSSSATSNNHSSNPFSFPFSHNNNNHGNPSGAPTTQTRTFRSNNGTSQVSVTTSSHVFNNPSELLSSVLNAFGDAAQPQQQQQQQHQTSNSTNQQHTFSFSANTSAQPHHHHHHPHQHHQQHHNHHHHHHQQHQHAAHQHHHQQHQHAHSRTARIPLEINSLLGQFQNSQSSLSRLSSLLSREASLSAQERAEVNNLGAQLAPSLQNLQTQLNSLNAHIRGTHPSSQSQYRQHQHFSNSMQQRAPVHNLNVHVHATVDELDSLPDRLLNFTNRVNLTRAPASRRVQVPTSSGVGANAHQQQGGATAPRSQSFTVIGSRTTGTPQSVIQQMNQPRASQQQAQATQQNAASSAAQSSSTTSGNNAANAGPSSNGSLSENLRPYSNAMRRAVTGGSGTSPLTSDEINQALNSDQTVGSILRNFSDEVGFESSEPESVIDHLLSVIMDELNMIEIMGIVGGDWTPLDRVETELCDVISEALLDGDLSKKNRRKAVESVLSSLKKSLEEDGDLIRELNDAKKPGTHTNDLINDMICITRTYLRLLVDTMLDGKEAVTKSGLVDESSIDLYSAALHCIFSFLIGELIDMLSEYIPQRTNLEHIILVLSNQMIGNLPQDLSELQLLGSNMSRNIILHEHAAYKEEYPGRGLHKTAPGEESADVRNPAGSVPPTPSRQSQNDNSANGLASGSTTTSATASPALHAFITGLAGTSLPFGESNASDNSADADDDMLD